MNVFSRLFLRPGILALLSLFAGIAAGHAQSVDVGWNFTSGTGAYGTGTPVNFAAGNFSIANSYGTVATPINGTSASGSYTGASAGNNIGNAVHNEAFSTGTSPYITVTLTPSAGYSLQISRFDFGMRSTATGATSYALYSSVDNYTAPIFTGSNTANSTWTLKTNGSFALNGAVNTAVTLRLYTYGGASNAGSGTINTRLDDIVITVAANAGSIASEIRVETAANGSGAVVPAQTIAPGTALTVYSITRDASHGLVANAPATWSLTNKTEGVVDGDLVAAGDNKSATFTPHATGSAVIHATSGGLTSVDSGVVTVSAAPTNPTAVASANASTVVIGQTVALTVTVTPGANPASTGLSVTGDLSAIGGSPTQAFSGSGNVFTYNATLPGNLTYGSKVLNFTVTDAQSRTATATLTLGVRGNVTIFHTNDTHARVTPHKWIVPQHSTSTTPVFEDVGGVAYMGAKVLSLATAQPDALVLDGGDISEGNPIGDWNGPGFATGTYGDGTIVDYYKILDQKLKAIPGRGGRGLDAMVVGNHDIRDTTYFTNMRAASKVGDPVNGFHLLSINICNHGTHTPYYEAYTTVTVNGNKIGIIGYTTESADSPEPAVNSLVDVVKCDWSSTDSTKIHFADIVNDLRNNQGCNMVILLTHMGHSGLCTVTGANPTPILVDTPAAKLPEVVVSGHWHTYCETVWQPTALNYKTIFTEAGSFQHYVGELRVDGAGKYLSSAYYPLRNSTITPDPDIAAYIETRKAQYAATNPTYGVDQVIGYTADDLLLDNYMKWWSADEYPWSGNNTAGNWICDAVQWKATALFGSCDLSLEAGGGVRSDIVAGPIKYTNIYETFPWADDTIYVVNMTGQQIWNFFRDHNCDAAMSGGWHVTAYDGVPTAITVNGSPIDLAHTYKVAINNYMYLHDSSNFATIDPNPQTSTYLARTALVDYTSQFTQSNPYNAGPARYTLNTDFSGGYRAVVTMMNDADSRQAFDDGFIRLLSATPETLAHRGTPQVPTDLVNADGTINRANRLTENEWYRSYLGFKTGAVKPGDIVEIWGKGAFFGGNPEFVDQEGIQSDGVEFKIVGHDDSLALPAYMPTIASFWNQAAKNHYVKFLARKSGTSTVTDQSGTTITIQDVTGYATRTLPGNNGDLLVITGVPTSESYALRFRSDSAVLASAQGITSYPPVSSVDAIPSTVTGSSLNLTATASVAPGANQNFYSLEPVADAQVESGVPGSNFGTSTNLFIQSAASGSFGNERAWLRFDLSSIPAGSTIVSAKLNLWCWKATGASLPAEVHSSATDSWSETGITWNNQPAFGAVLDTQTLASGVTNTWYTWDVTSFATTEFAGDKTVSLLVKPVTENSTDTTSPGYGFDSKEYTANHPYLQVTTTGTGATTTLTQVQFFYRYSTDNLTWGAWTPFQTDTTAPWNASFNFPSGYGYYEFYSVATDSTGAVEPVPPYADAATHYLAALPVTVTLGNLTATYDGAPHPVSVTTNPPGLQVSVTYNGSFTVPTYAGAYAVVATVTSPGYAGSASDTLTIAQAGQTINFPALAPKNVGDPAFDPGASATSGLPVVYLSSNPSVATVADNIVTIVGAGTATITAYQTGDSNYLAAAPVGQLLTVNASQNGTDGGGDVPAMPLWALVALAVLLFTAAATLLARLRQPGR